ncbi:MAG: hypothetical protein AAF749_02625 [Pseudomonadota bacterium]
MTRRIPDEDSRRASGDDTVDFPCVLALVANGFDSKRQVVVSCAQLT